MIALTVYPGGGGGLSLWDVDCVLTPRAALSGVQTRVKVE